MEAGRQFPILGWSNHQNNCPHSVPWEFIAPHEAQAWANHQQSLQRLAERGGLGPEEMYAVLRGEDLHVVLKIDAAHAVAYIIERLRLFKAAA